MDVKKTLEEEMYMNLLSDHRKENISNLVCRLKKIIYELKQSPLT
jgi:hypothetical protein